MRERVYRGKIDSPKTIHSVRDAALPGQLLADLNSWVADLPVQGDMAWMFPSENLRTPLAKDNVWRRSIAPKLVAVGLDWVDFHVFRRTSSSLSGRPTGSHVGREPEHIHANRAEAGERMPWLHWKTR